MYTLDEEKIEYALGNREIWFLAGQGSRECCIFTSDVKNRGIYLSLTLGTANFKQLDGSFTITVLIF